MKIRIGLVSNSSSTSYVIAITRDFKLSDEQKQKLFENYDPYEEDQLEIEGIEELFQKTVEKLCSSSQVWEEDDENNFLYAIVRVLKEEIVLTSLDGAPDAGCYVNVLSDKNKDDFIAKVQKLLPKDPH